MGGGVQYPVIQSKATVRPVNYYSLMTGYWSLDTERGGCFAAGLGYNRFMFHLSTINENIMESAKANAYTSFGSVLSGKSASGAACQSVEMVCGAGAENHFVVVRRVSIRRENTGLFRHAQHKTRPSAMRLALLSPPPADGRRGRLEMLLTVPNRCPTLHAARCGRLSPGGQDAPFLVRAPRLVRVKGLRETERELKNDILCAVVRQPKAKRVPGLDTSLGTPYRRNR